MRWSERLHSFVAHLTIELIIPFTIMIVCWVVIGILAYQSILTSLLVERQRQLASLAAVSVSELLGVYASILEALASNPGLLSESAADRVANLENAEEALDIFDAVAILDQDGRVLAIASPDSAFQLEVSDPDMFRSVRQQSSPVFSSVLSNPGSNRKFILVAVPLFNQAEEFSGALVGCFSLPPRLLQEPVSKLVIGNGGYSYLVDQQGKVIYHPDLVRVGEDLSDRPFVAEVMAGKSGGGLWESPSGERIIEANSPVAAAGWGVVVQEPWNSVIAPARVYGTLVIAVGLGTVLLFTFLASLGARRVVKPIGVLAEQTARLARGDRIEPFNETGIYEIDALGDSFNKMAAQITSFRAGLRRYLGSVIRSQEDERIRIARELHDETVQNLLAVARQLEFYQSSESNPIRQAHLAELQTVVTDTLQGIRQISKDLRPLMLEDLGLIPALQTLVRAIRKGEGALPHAKLEVVGQQAQLSPEQELAIYRIAQEALTNVRKHARATGVLVELTFSSESVELEISDDGVGFSVPASLFELSQQECFGLMGIQERAWELDGTLDIQSVPGQGTRLVITLPIPAGDGQPVAPAPEEQRRS